MSRLVTPSDFEDGSLAIKFDAHQIPNLQQVIDIQEERCLQELLGSSLYTAFVGDWDAPVEGELSEQRFIDLYHPFTVDWGCRIVRSSGLKKMVMQFVYFEYMRGLRVRNTTAGQVVNVNENSEPISPAKSGLVHVYNNAVATYAAVQWYINNNEDGNVYDEYNGQQKHFASWV